MPEPGRAAPHQAGLRFLGELQDLLPAAQRGQRLRYSFWVPAAVKDAIESCGVPHTEVWRIRINSRPAGFAARLAPGDEVMVYPRANDDLQPDAGCVGMALPQPLSFAVDANLGRLATLLRRLGLDTLYRNDFEDAALAALAVAERRVLLTRDRALLMRRQLVHGRFVRATQPEAQLLEVLRHFRLSAGWRPFSRCLRCNGEVAPVSKAEVLAQLPPGVQAGVAAFSRCRDCSRVYWAGTHVERMQAQMQQWQRQLADVGAGGSPVTGHGCH